MDVGLIFSRTSRGITLVEMITTLAVAAVSLAVLVPGWASLAERSRVTTAANGLLAHLRYARNEAVTRRQMITLCPSDDASDCSGDAFGWQRGYIVFVDRDGDRSRAPGEELLRLQGPLPSPLQLHTSVGRPAIRFRPDGAAWSTNATFSVCASPDSHTNRAVVLYGSGRARVDKVAPGNQPVTCR